MPETETTMTPTWIVTITWPDDPERGMETYGPFSTQEEQSAWVDSCQEAAAAGWKLLEGAHYLLHRVIKPFDVDALWEVAADAAVVRPKPRMKVQDIKPGDVFSTRTGHWMVREVILPRGTSRTVQLRLAAGRTDSGAWHSLPWDTLCDVYRETKQEPVCQIPDCGCTGKVHS